MTYQDDFTLPTELLEQVAEQGLDFLPELIRIVINTAMQVERQKHLGIGPYERSAERQGHANGFKPKTVSTRIAPITSDILDTFLTLVVSSPGRARIPWYLLANQSVDSVDDAWRIVLAYNRRGKIVYNFNVSR